MSSLPPCLGVGRSYISRVKAEAYWRPAVVRSWFAIARRWANEPASATRRSKTTSMKCCEEFTRPKRCRAPEGGLVGGRNRLTKPQTTHCFPAISDYIAPQRVRCARSLDRASFLGAVRAGSVADLKF